ncbi:MAG: metalloprotease [Prosthecobacter sp.]
MLRFRLFGFPVLVHWMFWLNTALLGGAIGASTPSEMRALLAFIIAAFFSVVIHELGHASVMRQFGDRSVHIVLHGFGGYAQGSRLFSRWQDIMLTAAGPGLQFAAGLAVYLALGIWQPPAAWLAHLSAQFVFVSLFWAVLNLVPILPLDGGRLCAAISGNKRMALRISWVTALVLAVGFFYLGYGLFTPLFFGFLAYNSWKQLQGESQIPWMDAR